MMGQSVMTCVDNEAFQWGSNEKVVFVTPAADRLCRIKIWDVETDNKLNKIIQIYKYRLYSIWI